MNLRGGLRCSRDIFYNQILPFGMVVDGRAGGLVIGRSHSAGDIYMLWEEDGVFIVSLLHSCLEGGEYIINAAASLSAQKRINKINIFNEPQPEINHLNLSPVSKLLNTHADPNDKLLWVDQCQFIVNKHATARHLAELEIINAKDNPYSRCDFRCFQCEVVEKV